MYVSAEFQRGSCSLLKTGYNLDMVQEISPIQYNFKIIDFSPVSKEISKLMLADMEKYGFLENPKFSKDIKRLLLHHTIHSVCNFFLKNKKGIPVILYFEILGYSTKFHAFYGESEVNMYLHNIMLKLKKILPVRIYIGSIPFEELKQAVDNNTGEGVDFLKTTEIYLKQYDFSKYTFSKIKLYTNRHKLNFLNQDYFNQLKTKNLLFT